MIITEIVELISVCSTIQDYSNPPCSQTNLFYDKNNFSLIAKFDNSKNNWL